MFIMDALSFWFDSFQGKFEMFLINFPLVRLGFLIFLLNLTFSCSQNTINSLYTLFITTLKVPLARVRLG